MSGIVAMDIATRTTYPEAANQVGILSFKKTASRFCSSSRDLVASESASRGVNFESCTCEWVDYGNSGSNGTEKRLVGKKKWVK